MAYVNFKVETDTDGITLVTWDMPEKSMNVFTVEVMQELNAIIDATSADDKVKGVVITSGKDSFSGGADLTMLEGMFKAFQKQRQRTAKARSRLCSIMSAR